jgi:hypothetical protein
MQPRMMSATEVSMMSSYLLRTLMGLLAGRSHQDVLGLVANIAVQAESHLVLG